MTGPKGPFYEVAPGFYKGADHVMGINIGEILVGLGIPDTTENRKLCWQVFKELGMAGPGTMIRTPDDPTWYRVGEIDGGL